MKDKFKRVEADIIGLWKFRVQGKKPVWCTYSHNGKYYDTQGKATAEAALETLYKDLNALKKRESIKTKKIKK